MAMTLTVDCAMCGERPPLKLTIEYTDDLLLKTVTKLLKRAGWIVQINGERINVYCSKECAK